MEDGDISIGASRLRETLDSMREGFQVIDPQFRYVYVNETVTRQGRKSRAELLGRTMMECYPGIEKAPFFAVLRRCLEQKVSAELENEFVHENGDREWFELRIQPCPEGASVLSFDISRRKRLEATLRQSQKMEAIGKLASGIAHDFNNVLTVISSYGSFLQESVDASAADVREILKAAERGAALTRQLLAFSRQRPASIEPASLDRLIGSIEPMLRRLLGESVRLEIDCRTKGAMVPLDVNGFEQVLVNLAVNARDALPDYTGTVTIETRLVDVEEAHAGGRADIVPPGRYAVASVSDTGCGMSREIQDRIFEPFFTTKPEGRGTGLGLATSYAIVKQLGGFIWVYSEPGRGSTFKIFLPLAEPVEERATEPPPPPVALGGGERILVVEDDPQILAAVARGLQRAKYDVVTAATVAEAAERLSGANEKRIDLLLSDVVLPLGSGIELGAIATKHNADIRTVFMTGYTERGNETRVRLPEGSKVLEKPFTIAELLRAIRDALGSPS